MKARVNKTPRGAEKSQYYTKIDYFNVACYFRQVILIHKLRLMSHQLWSRLGSSSKGILVILVMTGLSYNVGAFEEGFFSIWLDRLPIEKIQNDYQIKLPKEKIFNQSKAVVRIENTLTSTIGTGTFLTPDGLLITSAQMAKSCMENLQGKPQSAHNFECVDQTCKKIKTQALKTVFDSDGLFSDSSETASNETKEESDEDEVLNQEELDLEAAMELDPETKIRLNPSFGFQAKRLDQEIHCSDFVALVLEDEQDFTSQAENWKFDYYDAHDLWVKNKEKEQATKEKAHPLDPTIATQQNQPNRYMTIEEFQTLRSLPPMKWVVDYLDAIAKKEDPTIADKQNEAEIAARTAFAQSASDQVKSSPQIAFQLLYMKMNQARENALIEHLHHEFIQPALLERALFIIQRCEGLDDLDLSYKDYLNRRNAIPTHCDLRPYVTKSGMQGFSLSRYTLARDVRLVYAPSEDTHESFFQGPLSDDFKNQLRRLNLNFAFFRVYTNETRALETGSQPYSSGDVLEGRVTRNDNRAFFTHNPGNLPLDSSKFFIHPELQPNLEQGDFLYGFGHPKPSHRWRTYPHAKFIHDVQIPSFLKFLKIRRENLFGLINETTGKNDSDSKALRRSLQQSYLEDVGYIKAYESLASNFRSDKVLQSLEASWKRLEESDDDYVLEDVKVLNEQFQILNENFTFYFLAQQLFSSDLLKNVHDWLQNVNDYQENAKVIQKFGEVLSQNNSALSAKLLEAVESLDFLSEKERQSYIEWTELEPKELREKINKEVSGLTQNNRMKLFEQSNLQSQILNQPPGSMGHMNSVSLFSAVIGYGVEKEIPLFIKYFGKTDDPTQKAKSILGKYPVVPFDAMGDFEQVLKRGWKYFAGQIKKDEAKAPFPQESVQLLEFIDALREVVLQMNEQHGEYFSRVMEEVKYRENNLKGRDPEGMKSYSNTNGMLRFSYGTIQGTDQEPAICNLGDFIADGSETGFDQMNPLQKAFCNATNELMGNEPLHFQTTIDSINAVTMDAIGVSDLEDVTYGQPRITPDGRLVGVQVGHNQKSLGAAFAYMNSNGGRSTSVTLSAVAKYLGLVDPKNRLYEELLFSSDPFNSASFYSTDPSGKVHFEPFSEKAIELREKFRSEIESNEASASDSQDTEENKK